MPATTAPKNSQPLSCLSRLRQPQDAAEHYHHAWDLVQGASAQSGYRLAFNYMKAGQAVKAMEVAQTVLDKFPEYVQIKADVLQRVWALVKPPSDKA